MESGLILISGVIVDGYFTDLNNFPRNKNILVAGKDIL